MLLCYDQTTVFVIRDTMNISMRLQCYYLLFCDDNNGNVIVRSAAGVAAEGKSQGLMTNFDISDCVSLRMLKLTDGDMPLGRAQQSVGLCTRASIEHKWLLCKV